MDIVYVCKSGENESLRYSIRSILTNTTYNNVWIVGGKPDWYVGNYIPVKDIGNKFKNIQNCLSVVSDTHEISENFILMNDDFFILDKINKVENFYSGTLDQRIKLYVEKFGRNQYASILMDANNKIYKMTKKQPLNYDLHVPMVMNRYNLKKIINLSLAPRSVYGNLYFENAINIQDVKIYGNKKDQYDFNTFVSTEDKSFSMLKNHLNDLFANKSIYEK